LYIGNIQLLYNQYAGKKVGIISFQTQYDFPGVQVYPLSASENISEAAAQLFSTMRKLDHADIDIILAEEFPDSGLGKAINDRLQRAAYPKL
jgi:L-threonylcarbamoyladenylate synthase